EADGSLVASTASGPANIPSWNPPPRRSAPGAVVGCSPAMHWSSPVGLMSLGQWLHPPDFGTHSATHSYRFPTMSKGPRAENRSIRPSFLRGRWARTSMSFTGVDPTVPFQLEPWRPG